MILESTNLDGEHDAVHTIDLDTDIVSTEKRTYTFRSDSEVEQIFASLQKYDDSPVQEETMHTDGSSACEETIEGSEIEEFEVSRWVNKFYFGADQPRSVNCPSSTGPLCIVPSAKRRRLSSAHEYATECKSDDESLCSLSYLRNQHQLDHLSDISAYDARSSSSGYIHRNLPTKKQRKVNANTVDRKDMRKAAKAKKHEEAAADKATRESRKPPTLAKYIETINSLPISSCTDNSFMHAFDANLWCEMSTFLDAARRVNWKTVAASVGKSRTHCVDRWNKVLSPAIEHRKMRFNQQAGGQSSQQPAQGGSNTQSGSQPEVPDDKVTSIVDASLASNPRLHHQLMRILSSPKFGARSVQSPFSTADDSIIVHTVHTQRLDAGSEAAPYWWSALDSRLSKAPGSCEQRWQVLCPVLERMQASLQVAKQPSSQAAARESAASAETAEAKRGSTPSSSPLPLPLNNTSCVCSPSSDTNGTGPTEPSLPLSKPAVPPHSRPLPQHNLLSFALSRDDTGVALAPAVPPTAPLTAPQGTCFDIEMDSEMLRLYASHLEAPAYGDRSVQGMFSALEDAIILHTISTHRVNGTLSAEWWEALDLKLHRPMGMCATRWQVLGSIYIRLQQTHQGGGQQNHSSTTSMPQQGSTSSSAIRNQSASAHAPKPRKGPRPITVPPHQQLSSQSYIDMTAPPTDGAGAPVLKPYKHADEIVTDPELLSTYIARFAAPVYGGRADLGTFTCLEDAIIMHAYNTNTINCKMPAVWWDALDEKLRRPRGSCEQRYKVLSKISEGIATARMHAERDRLQAIANAKAGLSHQLGTGSNSNNRIVSTGALQPPLLSASVNVQLQPQSFSGPQYQQSYDSSLPCSYTTAAPSYASTPSNTFIPMQQPWFSADGRALDASFPPPSAALSAAPMDWGSPLLVQGYFHPQPSLTYPPLPQLQPLPSLPPPPLASVYNYQTGVTAPLTLNSVSNNVYPGCVVMDPEQQLVRGFAAPEFGDRNVAGAFTCLEDAIITSTLRAHQANNHWSATCWDALDFNLGRPLGSSMRRWRVIKTILQSRCNALAGQHGPTGTTASQAPLARPQVAFPPQLPPPLPPPPLPPPPEQDEVVVFVAALPKEPVIIDLTEPSDREASTALAPAPRFVPKIPRKTPHNGPPRVVSGISECADEPGQPPASIPTVAPPKPIPMQAPMQLGHQSLAQSISGARSSPSFGDAGANTRAVLTEVAPSSTSSRQPPPPPSSAPVMGIVDRSLFANPALLHQLKNNFSEPEFGDRRAPGAFSALEDAIIAHTLSRQQENGKLPAVWWEALDAKLKRPQGTCERRWQDVKLLVAKQRTQAAPAPAHATSATSAPSATLLASRASADRLSTNSNLIREVEQQPVTTYQFAGHSSAPAPSEQRTISESCSQSSLSPAPPLGPFSTRIDSAQAEAGSRVHRHTDALTGTAGSLRIENKKDPQAVQAKVNHAVPSAPVSAKPGDRPSSFDRLSTYKSLISKFEHLPAPALHQGSGPASTPSPPMSTTSPVSEAPAKPPRPGCSTDQSARSVLAHVDSAPAQPIGAPLLESDAQAPERRSAFDRPASHRNLLLLAEHLPAPPRPLSGARSIQATPVPPSAGLQQHPSRDLL